VKSFGKCRSHHQKSELRSENDFKSIVGTRLKVLRRRNGLGAWSYSTSKVKICNWMTENFSELVKGRRGGDNRNVVMAKGGKSQ
jgi:hypothetical protein